MTKRQKRKIVIISILALLLLLLSLYYAYYRTTHRLNLTLEQTNSDNLPAPQFLYSFTGPVNDRLLRPLGILVDGRNVYVTDTINRKAYLFNQDGRLLSTFGEKQLQVPLYIAKNPKTGNIYISDRRKRTVFIFSPSGAYLGEFDPHLPKAQLPKFKTSGVQWEPVALAFGPDGTFYVTEILNGHRLLVFNPEGKFVKSIGTAGIVVKADQAPAMFQFPNGIKIHKGLVYVSDSNNRRIQVFGKDGTYQRMIVTSGLPRGFDFLRPFSGQSRGVSDKLIVIDTLAHDGTIWSVKGDKIVNFGGQGVLDGQFEYPNDVSTAANNKLFITDTSNARVQVWGWPTAAAPIPIPQPSLWWALCLTPLLLLPLLLFLRKHPFFATADFVEEMLRRGQVYQMPQRRYRWDVLQATRDRFAGVCQDGVVLDDLLVVTEYSESDAAALKEKYELSDEMSATMAAASRARVICTEDTEVRRMSKLMELDVVNADEFLDRFAKPDRERGTCPEASTSQPVRGADASAPLAEPGAGVLTAPAEPSAATEEPTSEAEETAPTTPSDADRVPPAPAQDDIATQPSEEPSAEEPSAGETSVGEPREDAGPVGPPSAPKDGPTQPWTDIPDDISPGRSE